MEHRDLCNKEWAIWVNMGLIILVDLTEGKDQEIGMQVTWVSCREVIPWGLRECLQCLLGTAEVWKEYLLVLVHMDKFLELCLVNQCRMECLEFQL